MSSEEQPVNIHLGLDDVIAPVHVGIKRLILLVGDILEDAPANAAVALRVPRVFFAFDPAPGYAPSRGQLTSYVEERVLHWAMSDAVEFVKPLLVSARGVCRLYDRGASFHMTADEWNTMNQSWRRQDEIMSTWSLKRRLKFFSKEHPDFKMPSLLLEIRNIFEMRNCILHNRGNLTRSYCNEKDQLHVRFRRFSAWVVEPSGEHEYAPGEIVSHPQKLQVRLGTAERTWHTGEEILLTPQLFIDLCVTIDQFAIQMAHALEDYGRLKGIPFQAPGATQS